MTHISQIICRKTRNQKLCYWETKYKRTEDSATSESFEMVQGIE